MKTVYPPQTKFAGGIIKSCIYKYKTIFNNASVVLNEATYWLALPFISLVNNVSVISRRVTKKW